MKYFRPIGTIRNAIAVGLLTLVLVSPAYAAWYTVRVYQVVPRTDSGDVFVQLQPGAAETRFTGTVRGILPGAAAGTNKLMAVMLTAVALDAEITVDMAALPSWETPQVINGAGIVAP